MNRETIKFSNPLPLAVALCALLLGCTNTGVRDEIQGAPDVEAFTATVMWQVWMISAVGARSYLLWVIVEGFQESGDISAALAGLPSALSLAALSLLVAALFASLYFMWNVRHPKIE